MWILLDRQRLVGEGRSAFMKAFRSLWAGYDDRYRLRHIGINLTWGHLSSGKARAMARAVLSNFSVTREQTNILLFHGDIWLLETFQFLLNESQRFRISPPWKSVKAKFPYLFFEPTTFEKFANSKEFHYIIPQSCRRQNFSFDFRFRLEYLRLNWCQQSFNFYSNR